MVIGRLGSLVRYPRRCSASFTSSIIAREIIDFDVGLLANDALKR